MNHIEFCIEKDLFDWMGPGVVPKIDGVSMLTLIRDYEAAQGFNLPGSYAGLSLRDVGQPQNWASYFLGKIYPENDIQFCGVIWILGCSCGEAGCWPLEVHVTVEPDRIFWDQFRQPHRPRQDYSTFGPFVFARDKYERALARLMKALIDSSA